jgi:hypothetical protein
LHSEVMYVRKNYTYLRRNKMHLPDPIIAIFIQFRPLLTAPTSRKMLLLVCGTLLARGRRTVTNAIKMLGLDQEYNWPK